MSTRAKKSLGQHFLRSSSALKAIVSGGEVSPKDTVLEIGPGKGALTKALLNTGANVIAIEKDRELIPVLEEMFSNEIKKKQLKIIEGDALLFNPKEIGLKKNTYKLIANIPYYITGALFEKFLEDENHPERIVFLIQKEVATRIVARNKKESILSISVKAFGTPKIIAKVSREAFRPIPNVDSVVLLVSDISREQFKDKKYIKHFFTIVRGGFAHKRKLLIRNLEIVSDKVSIEKAFNILSISKKARAEDLELKNWIDLSSELGKK